MMKLSNMKIGRKLALVLGACVFLLDQPGGAGIVGQSNPWRGSRSWRRDRITKSKLADQVAGGASAAAFYVQNMVITKVTDGGEGGTPADSEGVRGAIAGIQASRADAEKSRGHAADMEH